MFPSASEDLQPDGGISPSVKVLDLLLSIRLTFVLPARSRWGYKELPWWPRLMRSPRGSSTPAVFHLCRHSSRQLACC